MTHAQLQQLAQLASILGIGGVVSEGNGKGRKSKGRTKGRSAKGGKWTADELAERDQEIRVAFARKGYKDVVLKDRNDPSKDYNVRPFGRAATTETVDGKTVEVPATGWLGQGRVVRKGQKSVKYGLFHITQTDAIETPKAN